MRHWLGKKSEHISEMSLYKPVVEGSVISQQLEGIETHLDSSIQPPPTRTMTACERSIRQKQSFASSPPIQYFPLRSCHVSCATSTLMSTSSGSLLTTSPTATSSLLLGLATYGFLGGGSSGLLFGGDLCMLEDGRGGQPHVGRVDREAPEKEREAPGASEGVGETV